MRWLPVSAMKRLPRLSTVTPDTSFNCALVAGPPSPLKPALPLPAAVVMMPLLSTLRMRALPKSAM